MKDGMRQGAREDQILAFWNERAALGESAGTNDLMIKKLEMKVISSQIQPGQSVLDVGCGNGLTAFYLARLLSAKVHGVDYSENMILEACKEQNRCDVGSGSVSFSVQDVRTITDIGAQYDVVLTERVLINLASWDLQKQAIRDLMSLVKPGGFYLMCENLTDSLANLNAMRSKLTLPGIEPPWHNCYLRREHLEEVDFATKVAEIDFTSGYYLVSRIVNAWLAKEEGREPSYDAPINRMAMEIYDIPEFSALDIGQTRLWIWRHNHE